MNIVVADVGGTTSRFAVFENGSTGCLSMRERYDLPTNSVNDFREMVGELAHSDLAGWIRTCDVVVIAVPGPVHNGQALYLPNVRWSISLRQLRECFPGIPKQNLHLVNDFVAHASASQTVAVADARRIQNAERNPNGVVSVMGAGTGFGFCSLLPNGAQGYVTIPSEAGHQDFVFRDDDEREFEEFLRKATGRKTLDGNTVVSGRGLALLHKFITGEELEPQQVSQRLYGESETSKRFATFYGRIASNYALCVLPTGGMYVVGGVAAKNPFLVDNDAFRQEFVASESHHDLLKSIPIYLNTNEESGIWGAAFYGQMVHGRLVEHDKEIIADA